LYMKMTVKSSRSYFVVGSCRLDARRSTLELLLLLRAADIFTEKFLPICWRSLSFE